MATSSSRVTLSFRELNVEKTVHLIETLYIDIIIKRTIKLVRLYERYLRIYLYKTLKYLSISKGRLALANKLFLIIDVTLSVVMSIQIRLMVLIKPDVK